MMMFLYLTTITLFILLCALTCFIVLIQESKSSGLGASFGGDSGESLFGTSTADVLKQFTGWLAVAFLAGCVILSLWTGVLGQSHARSASPAEFTLENFEG